MPIPAGKSIISAHATASVDQPRLPLEIAGPGGSLAASPLSKMHRSRRRDESPRPTNGRSREYSARGFALYVGVDESAAQAAGTSVTALARKIRAFSHSLAQGLESHAAVALGPANAPGGALDSVFSALGDPTKRVRPRTDAEHPDREEQPGHMGVIIDASGRTVHLDGMPVRLTRVEFNLLIYLMGASMRAVGREELLCNLWGDGPAVPIDRTIDVHIRRLRNKLGRFARTIRTERGAGYRFHAHPEISVYTPEYVI